MSNAARTMSTGRVGTGMGRRAFVRGSVALFAAALAPVPEARASGRVWLWVGEQLVKAFVVAAIEETAKQGVEYLAKKILAEPDPSKQDGVDINADIDDSAEIAARVSALEARATGATSSEWAGYAVDLYTLQDVVVEAREEMREGRELAKDWYVGVLGRIRRLAEDLQEREARLNARIVSLEAQIGALGRDLDRLGRAVARVESRVAEQGDRLRRVEDEVDYLRNRVDWRDEVSGALGGEVVLTLSVPRRAPAPVWMHLAMLLEDPSGVRRVVYLPPGNESLIEPGGTRAFFAAEGWRLTGVRVVALRDELGEDKSIPVYASLAVEALGPAGHLTVDWDRGRQVQVCGGPVQGRCRG